jgi:hypothetical protein
MNVSGEKVVGYLLLVIGVVIILSGALSIYQIFTGHATPVQIFHFPSVSIDLSSSLLASLPAQIRATAPAVAPTEIMSGETISATANLVGHFLLMGFILNVGYKLASLGVQLLRPIIVQGKTIEKEPQKA